MSVPNQQEDDKLSANVDGRAAMKIALENNETTTPLSVPKQQEVDEPSANVAEDRAETA